jgi:hypothetical protein
MKRWLPAVLIFTLLIAFRVIGSAFADQLPNLQPLPALLLCGWIFLKGAQRYIVPLLAWVVTDPVASLLQGYPLTGWHHLGVLIGLAATIAMAQFARRRPTSGTVLLSSLAAAILFYVSTNFVSFVVDPLYPKTLEGLLQAQWAGPVGMLPTWVFLRNLTVANLLFTSIFLLARQSLPTEARVTGNALAR